MRLSEDQLLVDDRLYFIQELPLLLGAFQVVLTQVRQVLDAPQVAASARDEPGIDPPYGLSQP